ncbi:MAG TPA: permease prefix domain 1-containing protein [Thermoanaerobaculia bacterium]
MTAPGSAALEEQIDQWRSYLRRRQAIHSVDVAELEDHLREQIDMLAESGLADDEAFLVAVKRIGSLDALSREFAREHSERLWKQLVVSSPDTGEASRETIVAFTLAGVAALSVRIPTFFGFDSGDDLGFYVGIFVILPLLTGYFAWKRRLAAATIVWLAGAFAVAAIVVGTYPFARGGQTEGLALLHLPFALLLAVGIAYAGGRWSEVAGRMDFVRFSGELFIYYFLIALVGGVLTAFIAGMFGIVGIEAPRASLELLLLPSGAAGAVFVAAWLVEAKQSVVENMAPVLTRLFTPVLAALMVLFVASLGWTGRGVAVDRNVLRGFDLLLVVVLAFLLYSISARDPHAPPGTFDVVQVALVISALLADAAALWAIAARITEFGFTPNRVAAVGLNVILLVNLAWSAVLYVRFVRKRGSFARLERWQTDYLPVYAAWAAFVAIVFPPLFRYR